MVTFKIGETDITEYIDIQNYNVNRLPVYDTWTDGNHTEHRSLYRNRIEGAFQVGFSNENDLEAFYDILADSQQVNGYYRVTSSVNNLPTTVEYDAYIDTDGEPGKYDTMNGREWLVINVNITER